MKIQNISIKWQLMIICIILVTLPTITLGIINYNTHKSETYHEIEERLTLTANDWKITTQSYITQMDRVLKREEFLVQKRLESISLDAKNMVESVYEQFNGTPSEKNLDIAYNNIAEIKIGRSGYVFVFDSEGSHFVSMNNVNRGWNLFDNPDKDNYIFFKDAVDRIRKLKDNELLVIHYNWTDIRYPEPRPKLGVFTYFEPLDLIIGASVYYTDFKSNELERILKDELKYKIAEQKIGDKGYIWIINSNGDYIVSKDRLRDGENIRDTQDKEGMFIVQEVIEKAEKLDDEETFHFYYEWKDIGEEEPLKKLAAITYIPEWDWIIGASAYHLDFLQGLNEIKYNILQISIFSIVFGSLIAYGFALLISNPIKKLTEYARKIKEGNLEEKCVVDSKNEIGELANTFDEMRIELKQREAQAVKDRNDLLNSLLTTFKGKFGNIATIIVRKNIEKLVKKNPRTKKILPKSLKKIIKKSKNLKK